MNSLEKLKQIGIGNIRFSKRNVPHLIYHFHSVVWFAKTSKYRIFWPWPSTGNQVRIDFKDSEDVQKYLRNQTPWAE